MYCAHHILRKGIAKSQKELVGLAIPASYGSIVSPIHDSSRVGSPASFSSYDVAHHNGLDNFGPSSLPSIKSDVPASFLERSFKAPREPRVTVWNPTDGRTISGNAAPCRRNLETWMRGHPGWVPKEEKQLSSSRRKRNQKVRPSSMPSTQPVLSPSSVEPESPHFNDALQGLLCLSRSPFANSPPNPHPEDCELTDHIDNQCMTPEAGDGHSGANHNAVSVAKKIGLTSSVSSSSAEEGIDSMSDGDVDDEARKMEL